MMGERRSSGTNCSQRFSQDVPNLLRSVLAIVAIEERKRRDSHYDEPKKI